MKKIEILLITTIALSGAAASLWIHRQNQESFRANAAALQEQGAQLAALTAEHERLARLIASPSNPPAADHSAEIAALRLEAGTLKKQTNESPRQQPTTRTWRASRQSTYPDSSAPEAHEKMIQLLGSARDLGLAFRNYADEHQNQSPSNLDQLTPYLQQGRPLWDANEFEIVYHGSLSQLEKIPFGSVAVVRSTQTWTKPDGKLSRIYGFADAHGQMVASDDNFQAWESQHVISPPALSQTGQ